MEFSYFDNYTYLKLRNTWLTDRPTKLFNTLVKTSAAWFGPCATIREHIFITGTVGQVNIHFCKQAINVQDMACVAELGMYSSIDLKA